MKYFFRVLYESYRLALQQMLGNRLRTLLSLLGIMIGIFCIIFVQSAVDSIQSSIKDGLGELGSDVLIVTPQPWDEDPSDNYWKYIRRPSPTIREYRVVRDRLKDVAHVTLAGFTAGQTIKYQNNSVSDLFVMMTTYEYPDVQNMVINKGRYFNSTEYDLGTDKLILGGKIANELFNRIDPINKFVKLFGRKFQVVGVLKEEGENPFNFINYDQAVWITSNSGKKNFNFNLGKTQTMDKMLYTKPKIDISAEQFNSELHIAMRLARKLKPIEEDNFAVNTISALTKIVDNIFGVINIASILIGIFALIVGTISVANIMFVSVQERTNIIGVKKALGAQRQTILLEFLIESIFLCLIGGLIGLFLVFLVTQAVTVIFKFPMWLSPENITIGIVVSLVVGVISGMIPAIRASKLDPVVAIRQ